VTFTPGVYCGQYAFSGTTIVLTGGTYVFKGGGQWDVTGGSLTGSGVSLHFTDVSSWTLNGLTALNLSAPTSGPQQGVLFSDSVPVGNGRFIIINRPANSTLSGLIYTRRRSLEIETAGANQDRLSAVVSHARFKDVTGWNVQPLTTSATGSGTGGSGAPSYLTR
jgi:hypothetical protein